MADQSVMKACWWFGMVHMINTQVHSAVTSEMGASWVRLHVLS